MSPLYKFSLNEETGKIVVQEIADYTERSSSYSSHGKRYWIYKGIGCWMYVYESKLDRYLSGHVYSFNPDITHARKIILESVSAKASKAFKEYKRWSKVKSKMEVEE